MSNGSAVLFMLLLGIGLVLLVTSARGRDMIDVALGRKRAT